MFELLAIALVVVTCIVITCVALHNVNKLG
jgi:hypothetical protein